MSLFYETIDSITHAIVTIKRAMKAGVIDKENYKELDDYLDKRAVDFKVKKSHIAKAKRDLDDKLELGEFFMDKNYALYKMAEDILKDFTGRKDEEEKAKKDDKAEKDKKEKDDLDRQAACKAWDKMNDVERATMAILASNWQTVKKKDQAPDES
jgi:hypothetical protein